MFHANTDRLIETWRSHRRGRRLPARADLSPIDFGPLLPQIFMLGREPDGSEAFRLCGGLIADLHGQELRGQSFYELWAKADRPEIATGLATLRSQARPAVITADAFSARGDSVGMELALAPLVGPSGEPDRTIGLYQPISTVARLLGSPVMRLKLRSLECLGEIRPEVERGGHLRLVVDNTRPARAA